MENSKKQEILKACFSEFGEHGYERANTNRICELAGVSKGLIFHYFGSKNNLYMMTVEKCIDDLVVYFNDFSVKDNNFISLISKYSAKKIAFFVENPMHYQVLMEAFYNAPKELRAEIEKKKSDISNFSVDKMVELFMELPLKESVNRENATSLMIALMKTIEDKHLSAICKQAGFSAEQYKDIEKEYIELMKLILYGIIDDQNSTV